MKKRTDWKTGLLIIVAAVLFFTLIDNFVLKKQLDVIKDREAHFSQETAAITIERNLYADSLRILKAEYTRIHQGNQLKEARYVTLQKRLVQLEYENSVILAHMVEAPYDTAYNELQNVYPTAEDLCFPFSGEQVRWIWHDVSALTLKEYELGLQKELLNKCNTVTSGKADLIVNLEHQNSILTESNTLADQQVSSLRGQLSISTAEVKRKTWWNRVLGTITAGLATYVLVDIASK
jgi:hypothetical protein